MYVVLNEEKEKNCRILRERLGACGVEQLALGLSVGADVVEESHQIRYDYLAALVFQKPDDVVVSHRVELYKYLTDKSDTRLLYVEHGELREILDDVADVLVEVRQGQVLHVLTEVHAPLLIERVCASPGRLVRADPVQAA